MCCMPCCTRDSPTRARPAACSPHVVQLRSHEDLEGGHPAVHRLLLLLVLDLLLLVEDTAQRAVTSIKQRTILRQKARLDA